MEFWPPFLVGCLIGALMMLPMFDPVHVSIVSRSFQSSHKPALVGVQHVRCRTSNKVVFGVPVPPFTLYWVVCDQHG